MRFLSSRISYLAIWFFSIQFLVGTSAVCNPINSVCASNSIASFQTRNLETFKDEKLDYCLMNEKDLPSQISKTIAQLGAINRDVAKVYDLPVRDVFPNGIRITLQGQALGDIDSTTLDNDIRIGVFPDWNGETIDSSSYAHETTHVVLGTENKTPETFKRIGHYGAAMEAIPDFIAYLVTGSFYTANPTNGLSECMNNSLREMDSGITFNSSLKFFESTYVYRKINACCVNAEKAGKPLHGHMKSVCQWDRDIMAKRAYPSNPSPHWEKSYSVAACRDDKLVPEGCDAHQKGIPVNSFLRDLDNATSGKVRNLYLAAFQAADNDSIGYGTQSCLLKRDIGKSSGVKDRRADYARVFSILRDSLDPTGQQAFDILWAKYGMDKLIEDARLSMKIFAAYNLLSPMKPWYPLHGNQDKCMEDLNTGNSHRFFDPKIEECRVICTEVKEVANATRPDLRIPAAIRNSQNQLYRSLELLSLTKRSCGF